MTIRKPAIRSENRQRNNRWRLVAVERVSTEELPPIQRRLRN